MKIEVFDGGPQVLKSFGKLISIAFKNDEFGAISDFYKVGENE